MIGAGRITRPILLAVLVAGAAGVWAGVSFGRSTTIATTVDAGLAVLIGANLLFSAWLWWKAKPGSGDAMTLPTLMLLSAAMLLGILSRLFWPSNDGGRMAASLAGVLIVTIVAAAEIRKRRRLRNQARTS